MIFLVFLLASSLHAQDDAELQAIRKIEDDLPETGTYRESDTDLVRKLQHRRLMPPARPVRFVDIQKSPLRQGTIREGKKLFRLEDDQVIHTAQQIYTNYYGVTDEFGFYYLRNKDGSTTFKVKADDVENIQEETALYEPPLKYTPAPENIVRAEYDKKLYLAPEASFYAGLAQGGFMRDLFNDANANTGVTTQYGLHLSTKWKPPLKVGLVVNYENTLYNSSAGPKIQFHAFSFGPQFKTKEFQLLDTRLRLQTQFRVSPFANAKIEVNDAVTTVKFNSADLLTSLEHPMKNGWGSFVLGVFYQAQWLNLRNSSDAVSISASNKINKLFGISLAQEFE